MQLPEKDIAYLYDIYTCCIDIQCLINELTPYDFEKDKFKRLAVERSFEIIGIASNKISNETKELLQAVPWKKMIGFRNILAHDYGEIRIEKMWSIARNSIPVLKNEIEKLDEMKRYFETILAENS